ncbi:hypothetical protein PAXRUDRAFT_823287 [Paxillus rubicundulus Ve08.2h10]|uniref:Secreted protein n=1 Tax=Paxillus rubicundulus Ve08.2h10 TaxID=930991 RepID=A0A0D0DKG7_9AGAM|nr:hypothetical protein PAXRUDRAFT_823287 [Paxillus rubicundulus Ve08.2h10]
MPSLFMLLVSRLLPPEAECQTSTTARSEVFAPQCPLPAEPRVHILPGQSRNGAGLKRWFPTKCLPKITENSDRSVWVFQRYGVGIERQK